MRTYTITTCNKPDERLALSPEFLVKYIQASLQDKNYQTFFDSSCIIIRRECPLAAILQKLSFERYEEANYVFPHEVVTKHPVQSGGLGGFFLANTKLVDKYNANPKAPPDYKFCLAPLEFQLAHLRHLLYRDQIVLESTTVSPSRNEVIISYKNKDSQALGPSIYQAKFKLTGNIHFTIEDLNKYFNDPDSNFPNLDYIKLSIVDNSNNPIKVLAMKLDAPSQENTKQKIAEDASTSSKITESTSCPPQLIIANMDFIAQAHLSFFSKNNLIFYCIANPESDHCIPEVRAWSQQLVTDTSPAAGNIKNDTICAAVMVGLDFEPVVLTLVGDDIFAFLQLLAIANYQFNLPTKWNHQLWKKEAQLKKELESLKSLLEANHISTNLNEILSTNQIPSLEKLISLKQAIAIGQQKILDAEDERIAQDLIDYFFSDLQMSHLGLLLDMTNALISRQILTNPALSSVNQLTEHPIHEPYELTVNTTPADEHRDNSASALRHLEIMPQPERRKVSVTAEKNSPFASFRKPTIRTDETATQQPKYYSDHELFKKRSESQRPSITTTPSSTVTDSETEIFTSESSTSAQQKKKPRMKNALDHITRNNHCLIASNTRGRSQFTLDTPGVFRASSAPPAQRSLKPDTLSERSDEETKPTVFVGFAPGNS